MSKNVRGSEIGGAELSGGETLQCSRTLIVEDFAMGVREREREREKNDWLLPNTQNRTDSIRHTIHDLVVPMVCL